LLLFLLLGDIFEVNVLRTPALTAVVAVDPAVDVRDILAGAFVFEDRGGAIVIWPRGQAADGVPDIAVFPVLEVLDAVAAAVGALVFGQLGRRLAAQSGTEPVLAKRLIQLLERDEDVVVRLAIGLIVLRLIVPQVVQDLAEGLCWDGDCFGALVGGRVGIGRHFNLLTGWCLGAARVHSTLAVSVQIHREGRAMIPVAYFS
jgi:hypothetical protein